MRLASRIWAVRIAAVAGLFLAATVQGIPALAQNTEAHYVIRKGLQAEPVPLNEILSGYGDATGFALVRGNACQSVIQEGTPAVGDRPASLTKVEIDWSRVAGLGQSEDLPGWIVMTRQGFEEPQYFYAGRNFRAVADAMIELVVACEGPAAATYGRTSPEGQTSTLARTALEEGVWSTGYNGGANACLLQFDATDGSRFVIVERLSRFSIATTELRVLAMLTAVDEISLSAASGDSQVQAARVVNRDGNHETLEIEFAGHQNRARIEALLSSGREITLEYAGTPARSRKHRLPAVGADLIGRFKQCYG